MKTLFQRLTLKQQDIILSKQTELPSTWTPIVGTLLGSFTWSKITLEQAMTIHFEIFAGGFDLDKFIWLFQEEDES
tara:strand:+ start:3799 stop:4026 length:228 start_codon:yes stop_codon:yes gene_type:complete